MTLSLLLIESKISQSFCRVGLIWQRKRAESLHHLERGILGQWRKGTSLAVARRPKLEDLGVVVVVEDTQGKNTRCQATDHERLQTRYGSLQSREFQATRQVIAS